MSSFFVDITSHVVSGKQYIDPAKGYCDHWPLPKKLFHNGFILLSQDDFKTHLFSPVDNLQANDNKSISWEGNLIWSNLAMFEDSLLLIAQQQNIQPDC